MERSHFSPKTLLCTVVMLTVSSSTAITQELWATQGKGGFNPLLATSNGVIQAQGQPVAVIEVGDGEDALRFKCFADGRVEFARADGKLVARAAARRPAVFREDGKVIARVTRPGIMALQSRATLGVVVGEVPSALAAHLDVDCSDMVLVLDVKKGQAADKAGVRKHDIIFEVDGHGSLSQEKLAKLIAEKKPGEKLELGLMRRTEKRHLKVRLGSQAVYAVQSGSAPLLRYPAGLKSIEALPSGLWAPAPGSAPLSGVIVDDAGRWRYVLNARGKSKAEVTEGSTNEQTVDRRDGRTEKAVIDLIKALDAQRKRIDAVLKRLEMNTAEKRANARPRK